MSAAEMLVAIAELASVFRAADGDTCYATVEINSHRETWPMRSKGFRRWLVGQFYRIERKPPGGQAVADALGVIEARAQFEGAVHPVHVRVAGSDTAIYLDLTNEAWDVVKVTEDGWRIVADPPVKFRRARGMLPLPTPKPGGHIDGLRQFVNVADEDQWTLLVAWLVAALRPQGPYPVLALLGEQGTAKSTTQELFRSLIDPNVAPLRAAPTDVRDVMIAASNGWGVCFDNLSSIEPWLSDCLCRLATGGGFSTRELYSDGDEMIFVAQRPVMLNGIGAVVERADLLDRALIVDLPLIDEHRRREKREFWAAFEAARPALLGALLDAVSAALALAPQINLEAKPRMADFAIWATAAEPGLGLEDGAFMAAYAGNRDSIHELALEASAVAASVRTLANREAWKGTAAELLAELGSIADEATKKAKSWPTTPRGLANALRRVAPNLRAVGVAIAFTDEQALGQRRRQIAIRTGGDSIVPCVPIVLAGVPEARQNAQNDQNDEKPTRSGCPRHPVTPRPESCPTCRGDQELEP